MAGNRRAKHDIAPTMRAAFIKGFDKYCRKHKMVYSDAMAKLIEDEGLLPVLNAMGKFAVREKEVSGSVDHNHKHSLETIPETNQWISGLLGSDTANKDKEPSTH